jgi:oligopeptidase B
VSPTPAPPRAERREVVIERFGTRRIDAYAWLRDPDWQRVMREPAALSPEIRAYLEAENAYADAILAPQNPLREALFSEMKGRIREDESSVPARDGGWAYYHRFVADGQHPLFCRCPSAAAETSGDTLPEGEQVLLNGNAEAKGRPFFKVNAAAHSPDHALFACAVDLTGAEYHTIEIRDTRTGKTLPDRMEGALPEIVWANDGRTLFYTIRDENHRPWRVIRHRIGEDSGDDAVVFQNDDPGFMIGIGRTESRRFIAIEAHDHADTSEVHLIDADAPLEPARLVLPRRSGIRYEVSDHGNRFFVLTNADNALDFRIAEAPVDDPAPGNWRDVVPHREGRLILHMLVFRDWLVRLEREAGLPRIVVREIATGDEHAIRFDEEAYQIGLNPGYEFATDTLRFTYSSLTTPSRVYDYDMRTRDRVLRKQQEVPSGHDPAQYVARRLFATSHDGVRVPVSVLHRRDTPLDGSAPLLLYGYGSYGFAVPAGFQPNRFSLVDRGFIYAIAHVRGGTDNGYGWYLDGKLMRKRNTFLDFIAAGEHLAKEGFTSEGNIVAHGGSAGGMLVGAAANIRPELFRAIVAEVPFVDVLNTMCDATLPLTPPEWVEWGNPIEDEASYLYMASYCPYTNVRRAAYPAVLATGGLTDPRVTYWEPAKWVAKLREYDTGENPTLLRINMDAGHGGAAGRFDRLREVALAYGFALTICGKDGT